MTLVDGGFHSVDSSDMAFKTATSLAMKEGLAKAEPILLEPVDHVTISVPNEFTPRAQRLLTGRRGQILGFAEKEGWPGWDDVVALVPEAELHDLIIELRSQTLGLARIGGSSIISRESRAEMKRGAGDSSDAEPAVRSDRQGGAGHRRQRRHRSGDGAGHGVLRRVDRHRRTQCGEGGPGARLAARAWRARARSSPAM